MGAAAHPAGSFLNGIDDVFTIMVHETDGWPSRNKVSSWVTGYTHAPGNGIGPQSVVWSDANGVRTAPS